MFRAFAAFLACLMPAIAFGQVPFPQLAQPTASFAYEDKDGGAKAIANPKRPPYDTPTPIFIPGARVIKTLELKGLLESNKNVVVVDVLGTRTKDSIPGAFKMSGGGDGQFYAAEKSRFSAALEKLTGSDKTRPIVFLCYNYQCWLSYNASLHALEAGYTDVIWYRGGIAAWSGASLDVKPPEIVNW